MGGKRKVWVVIQTRAPGEKAEHIGGAHEVGRFATAGEAESAHLSIKLAGGKGYIAQKEV